MELIPIVVVLALVKNDKGELLAQIRYQPDHLDKHNKWEVSGGKVEFDETPEQAVVRETKEETGLEVEVVSLWPKIFTQYWTSEIKQKKWKCTLIPYICRITGGELINPPTDDRISEIRFISPGEIENLTWGTDIDKNLLLEFSKQ